MPLNHPDQNEYRHFTKRQRVDTAIHTLAGIIKGIAIDDELNPDEIAELLNWCNDYRDLADRAPFNELIPKFDQILADGVIDPEEQEDLLWLCKNLSAGSEFYDWVTNEIQVLHGMLHGILADGVITKEEATGLQEWVSEHEHLKGSYPYDELDSLLMSVLADGKIDDDEQQILKEFFEDFIQYSLRKQVSGARDSGRKLSLPGICASCPEIEFAGKTFTFTGSSLRGTRKDIVARIEAFEAKFAKKVSPKTDYLVIGSAGNPCWAFSCYGRKVERAVDLRKSGYPILIVHESDFWDAVEDR